MYDRKVDDVTFTFHVSGMLFRSSLIMRDVQTGTLWSHLLGEGMKGKHLGTKLSVLPSVLTDWKTWKNSHPQTDVMMLPPTKDSFTADLYKDIYRFGVGFSKNEKSKLWTFAGLNEQPILNESFAGEMFVIWFEKSSGGAWGWDRQVQGKSLLEFELNEDGSVIDSGSKSKWDLTTGRAIEGSLRDTQLEPVALIPTFQQPWKQFHEGTEIWP